MMLLDFYFASSIDALEPRIIQCETTMFSPYASSPLVRDRPKGLHVGGRTGSRQVSVSVRWRGRGAPSLVDPICNPGKNCECLCFRLRRAFLSRRPFKEDLNRPLLRCPALDQVVGADSVLERRRRFAPEIPEDALAPLADAIANLVTSADRVRIRKFQLGPACLRHQQEGHAPVVQHGFVRQPLQGCRLCRAVARREEAFTKQSGIVKAQPIRCGREDYSGFWCSSSPPAFALQSHGFWARSEGLYFNRSVAQLSHFQRTARFFSRDTLRRQRCDWPNPVNYSESCEHRTQGLSLSAVRVGCGKQDNEEP